MIRRSLLILLLIGILLAACTPSGPGQPTPDLNSTLAVNMAGTMVAALFQTQTALAPSATNTALPTATSLPTSTALALPTSTAFVQQPVFVAASPTPTGPTPTPLASSLGAGCNNLRLISSYTVPEGPLLPGQDFTQFWQVENNGTCDWLYLYALVFASGTKLGEATSVRFGNKIPPGKWTTLSMVLHAPSKSGTYKSSWRFSDGGGTVFGSVLPVSITVGGPTNTPKPDTAATAVAQTVAAQNAINTAVAQTLTQAAVDATGTACAPIIALGTPCP